MHWPGWGAILKTVHGYRWNAMLKAALGHRWDATLKKQQLGHTWAQMGCREKKKHVELMSKVGAH